MSLLCALVCTLLVAVSAYPGRFIAKYGCKAPVVGDKYMNAVAEKVVFPDKSKFYKKGDATKTAVSSLAVGDYILELNLDVSSNSLVHFAAKGVTVNTDAGTAITVVNGCGHTGTTATKIAFYPISITDASAGLTITAGFTGSSYEAVTIAEMFIAAAPTAPTAAPAAPTTAPTAPTSSGGSLSLVIALDTELTAALSTTALDQLSTLVKNDLEIAKFGGTTATCASPVPLPSKQVTCTFVGIGDVPGTWGALAPLLKTKLDAFSQKAENFLPATPTGLSLKCTGVVCATHIPTSAPTKSPTDAPTKRPTTKPTSGSTLSPSVAPTAAPTRSPSKAPTAGPTASPTMAPTRAPSRDVSTAPTNALPVYLAAPLVALLLSFL